MLLVLVIIRRLIVKARTALRIRRLKKNVFICINTARSLALLGIIQKSSRMGYIYESLKLMNIEITQEVEALITKGIYKLGTAW